VFAKGGCTEPRKWRRRNARPPASSCRCRPKGDERLGCASVVLELLDRRGGRPCEHPKGPTHLPKPAEVWTGFMARRKPWIFVGSRGAPRGTFFANYFRTRLFVRSAGPKRAFAAPRSKVRSGRTRLPLTFPAHSLVRKLSPRRFRRDRSARQSDEPELGASRAWSGSQRARCTARCRPHFLLRAG